MLKKNYEAVESQFGNIDVVPLIHCVILLR